ncbi:MAG: hypothetical protein J5949_06530 [Oscillospiraceae bacterium]|nr:hypothetical protein [Oscillospiraceae bacterium]
MKEKQINLIIALMLAAVLCLALFLTGCGRQRGGEAPSEQNAAREPEALSGKEEGEPEEVPAPTPTPVPELTFPDGSVHMSDEKTLDLSSLSHADVGEAAALLRQMPNLKSIDMGSDGAWTGDPEPLTAETAAVERSPEADRDLTWSDLRTLQEAAPGAEILYRFRFYGRDFTTLDEEMDLNHSQMTDEGAAVREILPLMSRCRYLDMDSCGVSSEKMAEIRDAYPEMDVVWRIWFANNTFTMRTDSERLWCAFFADYMTDEYTQELKYLTHLKYLDLGHNLQLHNWDFLRYMPDLEVCIITASGWDTLDMLENCTKLEYLEIIPMARIELDLHPLAGMTELEHLNMSGMGKTEGWEVLLNMKKMQRLWIGRATAYYFPEGAMDQILEALPNARIVYETDTSAVGSWRTDPDGSIPPRYALLREQFDYDHWPQVAPYPYNDPKCKAPWET